MLKHLLRIAALTICTSVSLVADEESSPPVVVDGALVGNALVVLLEDGSMTAWSMPSGEKDVQLSQAFGNPKFSKIASSGNALWGANGKSILQWNSEDRQWVEIAPQAGSEIQALVAMDADLLQVYERSVVETVSGSEFQVPKLGGQMDIDYLRILAIYPQGETLWIGTGQGEWGGHLIALNTRTGRWGSYYDPLHYVTGITGNANESVYVSWSMSHFSANTLIRTHASNTEPVQEFEELESRYFQDISYSSFERKLYGIEQNSLVEIESGMPVELADLGRLEYGVEPNAIGVAPAVIALIPIDANNVIILHEHAAPMIFRGSQLQKLEW